VLRGMGSRHLVLPYCTAHSLIHTHPSNRHVVSSTHTFLKEAQNSRVKSICLHRTAKKKVVKTKVETLRRHYRFEDFALF